MLLSKALARRRYVRLTKNWRSHESILRFPNDTFYGGELEACGDPAIVNSLATSRLLPTPGFQVVFHGVAGMLCITVALRKAYV